MTLNEFKKQYQTLFPDLKVAENKRNHAKEQLDAYIADSSWRTKRNDELFEFLFSEEGISMLQKKLNASMSSKLNDSNVINMLKIKKEQLYEIYHTVDVRSSTRLALQHGCENKVLLGKNTPVFRNLVELTKIYQIQERLNRIHSQETTKQSLPEILDKLRNDYNLKLEITKKTIMNELEKKYRLYKIGESVTLKTRGGGTVFGCLRAISSTNIRLSGGNAGGRKIISFTDLNKDELIHFDMGLHDDTLRKLLNINYSRWISEHSFEKYVAPVLLEKSFFPYTIFERHSDNNGFKPKPLLAWASLDEYVAARLAELLPTHIKEYFTNQNMVYDNDLKEFTYGKLNYLKKQLEDNIVLCDIISEKKRKYEATYKEIVNLESKGASGEYEIYKMYLNDSPLGKSTAYAMDYLQRAADHNHHPAIITLARYCRYGEMCTKNVDKAIELYSSLANSGNTKCMLELADIYLSTTDGHFDEEKALEWCYLALEKDNNLAKAYMEKVANTGNVTFSNALTNLNNKRTMNQNNDDDELQSDFDSQQVQSAQYRITLPGGVILELVMIQPGSFQMGSPNNEIFRLDCDAERLHKVEIPKSYMLGKYEVTQKQWMALMDNNPSKFIGDNRPVENISWIEAKAFCEKLNQIYDARLPEGYHFDLPTDAQWEYGCRACTETAYNNGMNPKVKSADPCPELDELAWYYHNSAGETHEVGRKKPNKWGLHDMHGNVMELCKDEVSTYRGKSFMSVRGGSWYHGAGGCRSAWHGDVIKGERDKYGNVGFRLALVPIN